MVATLKVREVLSRGFEERSTNRYVLFCSAVEWCVFVLLLVDSLWRFRLCVLQI